MELEIKDATETTLLLITTIYSSRSRGTGNFTFMTNVQFPYNFPFLSNNIPSLPAYTIYPGLLFIWMFYSEGNAAFSSVQVIEQGYVKERLEFNARYGDLIKRYKVLNYIMKLDFIQWHPSAIRFLQQTMTSLQKLTFYQKCVMLSCNIFNGWNMLTGDAHSFEHVVPSKDLGRLYVPKCPA